MNEQSDSDTAGIGQAWALVEELRCRGYNVDVSVRPGWEYGCRVAPCGVTNSPEVIFESAPTAARAIYAAVRKLGLPGMLQGEGK